MQQFCDRCRMWIRNELLPWTVFCMIILCISWTLLWRIRLRPLLDVMLDCFCFWSPSRWWFLKHCYAISASSTPNLWYRICTCRFCLWCCALPAPFLCIFLFYISLYSESASVVWHSQILFLSVFQSHFSLQKDCLKGATVQKLVVDSAV